MQYWRTTKEQCSRDPRIWIKAWVQFWKRFSKVLYFNDYQTSDDCNGTSDRQKDRHFHILRSSVLIYRGPLLKFCVVPFDSVHCWIWFYYRNAVGWEAQVLCCTLTFLLRVNESDEVICINRSQPDCDTQAEKLCVGVFAKSLLPCESYAGGLQYNKLTLVHSSPFQ